ncbi:MAG: hypothetical protein DU481_15495 [Nitrosomonas sp.]|uniref:hypothetical protein n=1 Tax=Nitrosomonas sp. TaxID=42353 RepID=UPI0032F07F14
MSFTYNGLEFRTHLDAQWAAFFDLAGWLWWTNPVSVGNWKPDFKVSFECNHSECSGKHILIGSVLPVNSIEDFKGHPCTKHNYGVRSEDGEYLADGAAAFGNAPSVTRWEISHGSGAGVEDVFFRVADAKVLWTRAGELVK